MKRSGWVITAGIWALCLTILSVGAWSEDIILADFEDVSYGDWSVEGQAFGQGPAEGALPGQMPVSGYMGKRLATSFHMGDGATGTLTSPPFVIERRLLCFLIGGGKHPARTCMDLIVDGSVVRTATGPNDKPGGSERLSWQTWDVSEFAGKKAVLKIIDQHTGGWGHINIDRIMLCDEAPVKELAMRMKAQKRYLNLPVKNGSEMRRLRILSVAEKAAAGRILREFDIELAEGEPDYWVFCDMAPFAGHEIEIRVDAMPKDSKVLNAITQDDVIRGSDSLYREKWRPQFHFSSRRGWNNDPNGLVYHKGEYHLYYQHNPYGWNWGNMHWGHAVSGDLVHWTELPEALYPKAYGDWCFSGSAVVDVGNTTGFKTGDEDVIVAVFTSTGRGECIAFSNDRGRTFTDYEGNPIVVHQGRDPKVIWHVPTGQWVMAVYDEQEGRKNGIAFHTSPDLKQWTFQSRIEEYFECPEIFPIAVDGVVERTKWVVYAANGEYSVGEFDGREFKTEIYKERFNWGNCFYASQTFNNIPPEDGRRIQIAWGTVSIPGMPFNQMMTFPCELTLRSTDAGPRLFAWPVREIERLHMETFTFSDRSISDGTNLLAGFSGELFHIVAEMELGGATEITFDIRGTPIVYQAAKQELICLEKSAPLKASGDRIQLELLVDRTSIEIFGNGGAVYMPMGVILPEDNRALAVRGNGRAKAIRLEASELRSVWSSEP